MMIKSALMTTGYDVLDGGVPRTDTNPVLIFRQGAGHVQPAKALRPRPGLRPGFNDWLAFLCGTTRCLRRDLRPLKCAGHSIDPSDLNVAVDRDRRHGRNADGHAHASRT